MLSSHDTSVSTDSAVQQPFASDKLNGYDEFMSWRKSWNINSFTEEVFIEFFQEAAATLAPQSLPILFTTLKKGMRLVYNVNIAKIASLMAFLSQNGYIGRKKAYGKQKRVVARATIGFSNDQISKFLTEAPDAEYLAIKTAIVIGMHADCHFSDIRHIRVNMVNDFGTGIVVQIPQRLTDMLRSYHISGEFSVIVRKYLQLRLRAPREIKTVKFFIRYWRGKCCRGAMGRRTIGKMAQEIAKFLKLENPENYTTDSFRMISSKWIDNGVTCNGTRSVATSSDVGVKNATNSTDYLSLLSPVAEDHGTCDAMDVDTEDETSS